MSPNARECQMCGCLYLPTMKEKKLCKGCIVYLEIEATERASKEKPNEHDCEMRVIAGEKMTKMQFIRSDHHADGDWSMWNNAKFVVRKKNRLTKKKAVRLFQRQGDKMRALEQRVDLLEKMVIALIGKN